MANELKIGVSVLDRLLDDDPDQTADREESAGRYVDRIRGNLRRDLENLLNSRRRFLSWPAHFDQLDASLLNYGIIDFTNDNLADEAVCDALRDRVLAAVKLLEPRLQGIDVRIDTAAAANADRALQFHITGYILAQKQLEPLQFEARVEPVDRVVAVESRG